MRFVRAIDVTNPDYRLPQREALMNDTAPLFVDGAAYEWRMGRWSRLVQRAEFRVGRSASVAFGSISYEAFANAVKARVPS